VQLVPSHRRELQTTVSTSAGLLSALANTGVGRIVLDPGTYMLSAELSVTRSVVLEAAVAGSVVLHAQASVWSQRRVLTISPGSSGVVQLIGLNITGGYVEVRAHIFKSSHRPDGNITDERIYSRLRSAMVVAYVRQRPKVSQCPDGKMADTLASTHARTTANASVNYRMYVP
jgi:hypothetical protein